ncbi:hypothetical protein PHJA_002189200 [Phtheirospermum japonicum]|uniref:Telomere-associated protein Rif1 N-terminal domain-containing protein n=1 Tax=Phtheirospermum japonicum TaxID=374723 RepID=A0A830D244_9LAMI|nr:hypothetical protein PHJA_002189200 [Phtheirospermum japonicum]
MADFSKQIVEIEALLSSQNKALAYVKLLHLQEISAVESSAVEILADSCHAILSSIVVDISESDEEIAAQALKCLGFMIYHPSIVASIGEKQTQRCMVSDRDSLIVFTISREDGHTYEIVPVDAYDEDGDDANEIIQSLVKVIATTKIKQFSSSLLDQHFQPLLRAVTHALDNPIGSLSITFEAMQAVVKLTCSLTEQMRNMSSLWTPPIYRRLVSLHKRDRDMSERCLLKIMPLICPPPIILSKALATDLNKKLLLAAKELLDQGMKIQSLQAWGWFIRLLGPYATKDKHLVNEMLKILEQTFSDFDPQVQIASLVAWEGLIDALIEPEFQAGLTNLKTSECNNTQAKADRYSKRIKLIMAPIVGIMSSKCDVSVHASCLNTWSYLLHKLEASVSCQLVTETVWEPIIEVVFKYGPDNKNIWLWDFCLDLFDTLILGQNTTAGHLASGECPLRHYPINCSPWNLSQLDFFINMISILINRNSLSSEAALRLFGSLLETVQKSLRCVSVSYDEVIRCLGSIFGFVEKICIITSDDDSNNYCPHTCLKFLKVLIERLEPSILESPLYKVGLEMKCSKKLERVTDIRCADICFMDFEDKVLPVMYVGSLYFYVVVNSSLKAPGYDSLLQQMEGYLKFLLSSCNPQEVLRAFTYLLYKNTMFDNSLHIWVVLVNCLKKDQSVLKMETDNISYSIILHILSYPFALWSMSPIGLELQIVIDLWTSLYVSVDQEAAKSCFSGDLCAIINGCIDRVALTEIRLKEEKCGGGFCLLCGNVIICVLKQLTLSLSSKGRDCVDRDGRKVNIANSVVLAVPEAVPGEPIPSLCGIKKFGIKLVIRSTLTFRFLSELVNFVGCLNQKEDVLMFVETASSPLIDWLSEMHILDENSNYQLQLLWSKMLNALQQSQPSIKFDSSFLKSQEPLLERALDHPNRAISESTINFWNSTYGARNNLEFPKNLVPVLDKLSRNGKINICSRNHHLQYNVTNTLKKCSKRVEIVGNPISGPEDFEEIYLGAKRKRRPELTEHQKEVRRAQQGRATDCNGHGPGIRTYTSVDFSQGNEESQDSPDIRDAESILGMLRKVCS